MLHLSKSQEIELKQLAPEIFDHLIIKPDSAGKSTSDMALEIIKLLLTNTNFMVPVYELQAVSNDPHYQHHLIHALTSLIRSNAIKCDNGYIKFIAFKNFVPTFDPAQSLGVEAPHFTMPGSIPLDFNFSGEPTKELALASNQGSPPINIDSFFNNEEEVKQIPASLASDFQTTNRIPDEQVAIATPVDVSHQFLLMSQTLNLIANARKEEGLETLFTVVQQLDPDLAKEKEIKYSAHLTKFEQNRSDDLAEITKNNLSDKEKQKATIKANNKFSSAKSRLTKAISDELSTVALKNIAATLEQLAHFQLLPNHTNTETHPKPEQTTSKKRSREDTKLVAEYARFMPAPSTLPLQNSTHITDNSSNKVKRRIH